MSDAIQSMPGESGFMAETPVRSPRVLVVDEEKSLTELLQLALGLEGWQVRVAADGAEAVTAVAEFAPDIVLLDMMLPDVPGTEVVATLRQRGITTPVVFLTGRSEPEDRLAGYAAGADDYLTKPFGLEEVVDHLQPIVRRLGLAPSSRRYADLVLDVATGQVWRGDEHIPLTPMEFEMLRALIEVPEARMTLGQVLRAVAVRGARVPRQLAERMLERMRSLVNGASSPLVHSDADGSWMVAIA
jgi:DNA-binding response OmpR family regulator